MELLSSRGGRLLPRNPLTLLEAVQGSHAAVAAPHGRKEAQPRQCAMRARVGVAKGAPARAAVVPVPCDGDAVNNRDHAGKMH